MLVPTMAVLGPQWQDQGDPGTSLDLTNPPAACAPFTAIFDGRTETVLHEFSYLPLPDGSYEQGHINLVALRAAAPMVADELRSVAAPSYAACAEASATRRFQEVETGTIDTVSARTIASAVSGANVLWRATVTSHTSDGSAHTMYMDIAYFGAANVLVKIRIASCGCRPPVTADAPLMTGEGPALQSIALQLAKAAYTA